MLGKNVRESEIQKWLSDIGESPDIQDFGHAFFYDYKSKGIALRFDTTDTLTSIFLHPEGSDGYRQYQGRLPFKLSFMLNRNEVESILGKPDESGGEGIIKYWAAYTSKGIRIVYDTKQTENLNARIYTVVLTKSR